jgi:hypothetical protein
MNTSPEESSRVWSPMLLGGVIVGALLLLLLIPTFRAPEPQGISGANGDAGDEDVSQTQCERTLMSAMEGLRPDRLGVSSETRVMVDTLNNWFTQCVDQTAAIVDQEDQELREQLLTPDGFSHSRVARFQLRDAEHVRNSLLAANIVERVTADLRTDQQRALALFYYVVRTVDLLPEDSPDLRLTPYESLVLGIGTAADRGWTYALLMRQLRLDVVMIQPRGRPETTYWLLGAVMPGEGVLLLDPRMGLPISPASDVEPPPSPLPEQAATLREVRENEQLLRQYDRQDRKYPLTAEDLRTVDVYAIGTSSTFAPRLGRLQAAFPEAGELYDGLASNELREVGLLERLRTAGENGLWSHEQVHVWPYPQRFWLETTEQTDEQKQRLANMQAVLTGPRTIEITVSIDEQDELQLGATTQTPQRSLLQARIEQLLGNFAAAQQAYLQIRLNRVDLAQVRTYFKAAQESIAEQIENPQEAQQTYLAIQQQVMQQINGLLQATPEMQLNALAGDMATYWAAQIHYEQQDYRLAAEDASAYVQRGGGNFIPAAIYLAKLALAQDERPQEAVALAARHSAQILPTLGDLNLTDRWRKLSEKPGDGGRPSNEPGAEQPAADENPQVETEPGRTATEAKPESDQPAPSTPQENPQAEDAPASGAGTKSSEDGAAGTSTADDTAGTNLPAAGDQPDASDEPAPAEQPNPTAVSPSSRDRS